MDVVSPPAAVKLEAVTRSSEETRRLAGALSSVCVPGDVLLLSGDLGAGKTVFAQGFAAGLGITDPVTSPTFILVRPYPVPVRVPDASSVGDPDPVRLLAHADLYRLDRFHEVEDLGIDELLERGGVALVEWGEAAGPVLAEDALTVTLVPLDDGEDTRAVSLAATADRWVERWTALATALEPWACLR
jgi:tRNA threonylcarbamoyladenosine biosynthesis protein TsaE